MKFANFASGVSTKEPQKQRPVMQKIAKKANAENASVENAREIGNYLVSIQNTSTRIFPKNKDGKTMMITLYRSFIILTHKKTGQSISFKYLNHQRRTYWHDERRDKNKRSVPRRHVISELARLLYNGNKLPAERFVAWVEDNLYSTVATWPPTSEE